GKAEQEKIDLKGRKELDPQPVGRRRLRFKPRFRRQRRADTEGPYADSAAELKLAHEMQRIPGQPAPSLNTNVDRDGNHGREAERLVDASPSAEVDAPPIDHQPGLSLQDLEPGDADAPFLRLVLPKPQVPHVRRRRRSPG